MRPFGLLCADMSVTNLVLFAYAQQPHVDDPFSDENRPAAGAYVQDRSWQPAFPSGSHTFSAVGVSRRTGHVYVTQRGNVTMPPVLVLDSDTGALVKAWGERDVAATSGEV